jgi:hypothetical protein
MGIARVESGQLFFSISGELPMAREREEAG